MNIFIATSKKFYPEAQLLVERIKRSNWKIYHPYFGLNLEEVENNPETKALLTLKHFPEIDDCDILYALLPEGYIGFSVTIEITYAYAKGKRIFASEKPTELAVRSMIEKVMDQEQFVKYLQAM
jgi:hypothetical protein